jgi:hypothetical protein
LAAGLRLRSCPERVPTKLAAKLSGRLANVIAGIVYAVAMPLVALVTTYVYFDARTRGELEAESDSPNFLRRSSSPRRSA